MRCLLAASLLPFASSAFASRPKFDGDVLNARIASQKQPEQDVLCLIIDTMVPKQRLNFQFGPPVSDALVNARDAGQTLVVVGRDHRQGKYMRRGVEARIESGSSYRKSDGYFASHALSAFDAPNARGYMALDTTLRAERRCELLLPSVDDQDAWPPSRQVFSARVRWLEDSNRGCSAAEVVMAEELVKMVGEWLELVRTGQRERVPDQMKVVLTDLGPMPDPEECVDSLAFWVAGCINPVPALGVAREIRPRVLEAADGMERLKWVHAAVKDSTRRLKSMPPGPFEVEPPPGVKI
jgi:hypothetical protein